MQENGPNETREQLHDLAGARERARGDIALFRRGIHKLWNASLQLSKPGSQCRRGP